MIVLTGVPSVIRKMPARLSRLVSPTPSASRAAPRAISAGDDPEDNVSGRTVVASPDPTKTPRTGQETLKSRKLRLRRYIQAEDAAWTSTAPTGPTSCTEASSTTECSWIDTCRIGRLGVARAAKERKRSGTTAPSRSGNPQINAARTTLALLAAASSARYVVVPRTPDVVMCSRVYLSAPVETADDLRAGRGRVVGRGRRGGGDATDERRDSQRECDNSALHDHTTLSR